MRKNSCVYHYMLSNARKKSRHSDGLVSLEEEEGKGEFRVLYYFLRVSHLAWLDAEEK